LYECMSFNLCTSIEQYTCIEYNENDRIDINSDFLIVVEKHYLTDK
jgi:hypothetical protein